MRRIACLVIGLAFSFGLNAADDIVTATAHVHGDDEPVATPVAELAPRQPVTGAAVDYATIGGKPVTGYLARPVEGAENAPALIVIHEWWGLNDNIRQVTERLAGEGYTALAVDLYLGDVADNPKQAVQYMQGLMGDVDTANENLRAAFAYLENEAGAPRIGVVGWCLGGQWSLRTALLMPEQIDAAVIYYGSLNTDPDALATLQMPVMGNFAENDPLIPLDSVEAFRSTLEAQGKDVDVKVYTGAKHAFSNPSGTAYDAKAAADAWQRTTGFFAAHLK
jgi:carboxymethylenebutenolidase